MTGEKVFEITGKLNQVKLILEEMAQFNCITLEFKNALDLKLDAIIAELIAESSDDEVLRAIHNQKHIMGALNRLFKSPGGHHGTR